jgi:hypothetical protein
MEVTPVRTSPSLGNEYTEETGIIEVSDDVILRD